MGKLALRNSLSIFLKQYLRMDLESSFAFKTL